METNIGASDVPKSPKLNKRGEPFKPGDLFLDKYIPDAEKEEREIARGNLQRYGIVVARIAKRMARDEVVATREILDDLIAVLGVD